jgi:hypothetical protein
VHRDVHRADLHHLARRRHKGPEHDAEQNRSPPGVTGDDEVELVRQLAAYYNEPAIAVIVSKQRCAPPPA